MAMAMAMAMTMMMMMVMLIMSSECKLPLMVLSHDQAHTMIRDFTELTVPNSYND
jgi:hypothetical protein